MVKAMAEMTSSRYMSSNEHETNSSKKHMDKSQEVSSIVMRLNRKKNYSIDHPSIILLSIAGNLIKRLSTSVFCTPLLLDRIA